MTEFTYKAMERGGKIVSGSINAVDEVEATRKLAGSGHTIFELCTKRSASKSPSAWHFAWNFGAGKTVDQVQFFSDLALLTGAGLTVSKALEILAKSGSTTAQANTASLVLNALSTGSSASAAFSQVKELSRTSIALISSGENSGKVHQVFSALALQLGQSARNKAAVVSALVYPLFLVVLMILAFSIVTFVLVPALEPAFENTGSPPPLSIRIFSSIRYAAINGTPAIMIVLLACCMVLLLPGGRRILKELSSFLLARAPWIGTYLRNQQLAQYLNSLSMLLDNGVVLSRSLELAKAAITHPPDSAKLEAVRMLVTSGTRLPDAYEQQQVFDARILSVLAVGFEAGKTGFATRQAAHILEEKSRKAVDRFLAILTPAITIFMGLAVGGLILSVMTALLSINELAVQ